MVFQPLRVDQENPRYELQLKVLEKEYGKKLFEILPKARS
jgi:hypothetical protein